MKILIDMNLSPDWIRVFSNYNIESVHWSMIGDPRATDKVILDWAFNNNYIVFTNDLDFGTLLALTQATAPSVIQIRTQDLLPSSIENIVLDSLRRFQNELESGALVTVDLIRSKVRILPIIKDKN